MNRVSSNPSSNGNNRSNIKERSSSGPGLYTMMAEPASHAHVTFEQVESHGEPSRPLEFPSPRVGRGVRVNALVVDSNSGSRKVWPGVIHREDVAVGAALPDPVINHSSGSPLPYHPHHQPPQQRQIVAYAPSRRLQDAIYGSVWACVVLRKHHGVAADDAARAAGVEPGSIQAPIVWETTNDFVAIKMIEWARVHHMRGRLLEDPIKEVAAMQLVGNGSPHVLGPIDVLQDGEYLFTVMPYCSGGDLFGVVVKFAEESGGEIGMPEPVARYWFRQILWVSYWCCRSMPSEVPLEMSLSCMDVEADPMFYFMFSI
jgi:hypothetical protein